MRRLVILTLLAMTPTTGQAIGPVVARVPAAMVQAALGADTERDPVKLAARIGKNSRTVSDLLAARNTSPTTRLTQSRILRDMDRLLEQPDSPPPPSGGGGQGEPPPPPPESNGEPPPPPEGGQPPPQNESQPPMPQKGNSPPKPQPGSQQPGGQQPQKPGTKPSSWRNRAGNEEPAPKPQKPGSGEPMPGKATPKKPGGTTGSAGEPGQPPPPPVPAPPAEDAIVKQVWGHLPEQLRREMNQYYQEQFMPKYSDMLRDYYSGLAKSSRPPAPPR